jgi:hypothetical protein
MRGIESLTVRTVLTRCGTAGATCGNGHLRCLPLRCNSRRGTGGPSGGLP